MCEVKDYHHVWVALHLLRFLWVTLFKKKKKHTSKVPINWPIGFCFPNYELLGSVSVHVHPPQRSPLLLPVDPGSQVGWVLLGFSLWPSIWHLRHGFAPAPGCQPRDSHGQAAAGRLCCSPVPEVLNSPPWALRYSNCRGLQPVTELTVALPTHFSP